MCQLTVLNGGGKAKQNAFFCACTDKGDGSWLSKTSHDLIGRNFDNGDELTPIQFPYFIYKCSRCGHEMQTPEQAADFQENYLAQRREIELYTL